MQQLPGSQHRRPFAEGQQPGNIRKDQWRVRGHSLERREIGKADHYDRRPGGLGRDAHIHTADRADWPAIPIQNKPFPHLLLDTDRLLR